MASKQLTESRVREIVREETRPVTRLKKVMLFLREWGSVTALATAFFSLIAIVVTLAIFAGNKISHESQFEGATSEHLRSVDDRLKAIEAKLGDIGGKLLASQILRLAETPADAKSQSEAMEILASSKKDSAPLPVPVIDRAGEGFLDASQHHPDAWKVALDFAAYRSTLNTAVEPDAVRNGRRIQIGDYGAVLSMQIKPKAPSSIPVIPVVFRSIESTTDADKARVEIMGNQPLRGPGPRYLLMDVMGQPLRLDGMRISHTVIRNAEVVYEGAPVELEDTIFINCVFDFQLKPHGQELIRTLLKSDSISYTAD